MRKPVKILAFILVFLLSVLLALAFCASYIFDSKFNDALRLVNSRQSYARIVYTPVSSSLLSKKGKVSVTVPESPVGELRATFAVDINFSVSSFTVRFHKENYDGNIDELLSSIGLPVIDMTAINESIAPYKVIGIVGTDFFKQTNALIDYKNRKLIINN